MARLLRKIPKHLNPLPIGWHSREELVLALLNNLEIVEIWNNLQQGISFNTVDEIVRLFFIKNSWQLTSLGAIAMYSTCQSWALEHTDNAAINGRVLINMGRITQGPWCNRGRHVYVWNEGTHFEMLMFDGSIKRFVDFYLK
jgi:hypothetical protein